MQPPAHVAADPPPPAPPSSNSPAAQDPSLAPTHSSALPQRRLELVGTSEMQEMVRERRAMAKGMDGEVERGEEEGCAAPAPTPAVLVDPERNEALERERPGDAIFRAVFGSDGDSDSEGEAG